MNGRQRAVVGVLLFPILAGGGIALIRLGSYGLTLFILLPILLGAFAAWVFRPRTAADSVRARRGASLLLLLPPGILRDAKAVPPVYEVRTAIVIAAPADRVRQPVASFSELPEPHEWYFRDGLAFPKRARIVGSGPGAISYCEFSTGAFVEPIEIWNQPRLLRFRVTDNPAPMHEWSPYARVLPKHLHGYLVSKRGQFLLTPLPGNRTLLEGTTWYQHGLGPTPYWRLWSDAIIHRIHLRVLTHIKTLAEKPW